MSELKDEVGFLRPKPEKMIHILGMGENGRICTE
jgi:hypothetical protein